MFNERKALQMTLQALLEQRMVLRRQYVDQDKQLGSEIKQLLSRIREIDLENGPETSDVVAETAAAVEEFPMEMLPRLKVRKAHVRHDYEVVAERVKDILRDRMAPLSLGDLCDELKQKHGIEFSSPYIGVQKALRFAPEIKIEKSGRKLMFTLE